MSKLFAILMEPSDQLVELIARTWANDDAIAILDPRSPSARIQERLAALQPHWIIDAHGQRKASQPAPPLPERSRIVITTSGTTGPPKAVVHTEDNMRASANAIAHRLAITQADTWFCPLSPAYIGGLAVIARSLLLGNRVIVSQQFDQAATTSALKRGATLTVAVTAALTTVDLSGFRTVLLGAQPPPAMVPANAIVTYGMTETGSGVIYDGEPLDGVDTRVRDGLIELRGPMIAERYRDGSSILDDQGWLHTGDLGAITSQGRLVVEGRASDLINSGGHKVNPLTVEAAAKEILKGVATDLCVFGSRDDRFGETVTLALVTSHEPPELDQLRSALTSLERWERPRRLIIVEEIPRTETGKPQRNELARRFS